MTSENITDKEITDFLLGRMDGDRAELVEELAFTDDDFADKIDAAERDLLDAYVAGQMEPADAARFESHYAASPLRREKVAFAGAFKTVADLPQARASPAVSTKLTTERTNWWSAGSWFRPAFQLSFAALAVVAATAAWWFLSGPRGEIASNSGLPTPAAQSTTDQVTSQSDPTPLPEGSPIPQADVAAQNDIPLPPETVPANRIANRSKEREKAVASRLITLALAAPVRGGQLQNLSLPPDAGRVAVGLDLESIDFPAYRVDLIEQTGGTTIWRSATLRPKSFNGLPRLNLTIPASLLKPRIHRFSVSGVARNGSTEKVGDYPFKVVQ